jgi:putative hydrolase of the HAD superfamily
VRDRARALLIDLDGVLRRFDPLVAADLERRHSLAPGAIESVALQWDRLRPALVGEATHGEWLDGVAADLASRVGGLDAARTLVAEWHASRGDVDADALGLVREVRRAGLPVALATNAMDDIASHLDRLGLAGEFDAVVASVFVGTHKPTREYFAAACEAVRTPPNRCLLVDDTDRNVLGARAAGLLAYRWTGPGDVHYLRAAFDMSRTT